MDLAPLLEFTLKTGRRVDVFGIGSSGELVVVEVKSSRQDYLSDRKWQDYLDYCDQFYFAVPEGFPLELLPDDCGLMCVDTYGGAVLRPAPLAPVKPARRKAVTARYARAAALRLRRLEDPEASIG
ncbi:MAG: MmcB family DNA repair protein [Alphaproteobacteria bacterium]|nr:MmcB family DNA repair protein [Alphaproteobacteria bacterium]